MVQFNLRWLPQDAALLIVCWTISKHPRHETNYYKPDIKYSISPSPYLKKRNKKEREGKGGRKEARKEMIQFYLG